MTLDNATPYWINGRKASQHNKDWCVEACDSCAEGGRKRFSASIIVSIPRRRGRLSTWGNWYSLLLLGWICTGKDVSAAGLLGGGGFDVVDVVGKLDNAAGGFGGGRDGDFTGDTMFCSCGAAGMGTFSELVRKLLYSSSLLPSVSTDS